MKPITILFFVLALSQFANSQKDSSISSTEIGSFNIRKGAIIKKEYVELASYQNNSLFAPGTGNINFKIIYLTDAASNTKSSGLFVSTNDLVGSTVRTMQKIDYYSYVDSDEVDALIKYLEFVSLATEKNEENQVEYVFNSKDIQFITFNDNRKRASYIWNFAIKVNKSLTNSTVYLHYKEISDLLQKLNQRRDEIKIK